MSAILYLLSKNARPIRKTQAIEKRKLFPCETLLESNGAAAILSSYFNAARRFDEAGLETGARTAVRRTRVQFRSRSCAAGVGYTLVPGPAWLGSCRPGGRTKSPGHP